MVRKRLPLSVSTTWILGSLRGEWSRIAHGPVLYAFENLIPDGMNVVGPEILPELRNTGCCECVIVALQEVRWGFCVGTATRAEFQFVGLNRSFPVASDPKGKQIID